MSTELSMAEPFISKSSSSALFHLSKFLNIPETLCARSHTKSIILITIFPPGRRYDRQYLDRTGLYPQRFNIPSPSCSLGWGHENSQTEAGADGSKTLGCSFKTGASRFWGAKELPLKECSHHRKAAKNPSSHGHCAIESLIDQCEQASYPQTDFENRGLDDCGFVTRRETSPEDC